MDGRIVTRHADDSLSRGGGKAVLPRVFTSAQVRVKAVKVGSLHLGDGARRVGWQGNAPQLGVDGGGEWTGRCRHIRPCALRTGEIAHLDLGWVQQRPVEIQRETLLFTIINWSDLLLWAGPEIAAQHSPAQPIRNVHRLGRSRNIGALGYRFVEQRQICA